MVKFLRHRRSYSLIVCIAILLNLLAPAIDHAMAQLSRDPLALEICSVGAAPTKQPPPGLSMFERIMWRLRNNLTGDAPPGYGEILGDAGVE
ncbi:MAG: DUF2946 family protein, partial [Pseudomonadota bacterium]